MVACLLRLPALVAGRSPVTAWEVVRLCLLFYLYAWIVQLVQIAGNRPILAAVGLLLLGGSVHLFVALVLPGGGFRAWFSDTGRQTGHLSRDVLFLGKTVLLYLLFCVPLCYRAAEKIGISGKLGLVGVLLLSYDVR